MTPGRTPRPAAIWAIRCLGVAPDAPNAIMWLDIAEAPAVVPATTAPSRNRSMIASARSVPPIVELQAELVAAGHEDPGRVADGGGVGLVVGLGAGHRVERADPRDAQLAEDLAVALAGFHAHRGRGRDHRDGRVLATGEGDEAAEDDPIADLVLGAPDDDDGSVRHRLATLTVRR